MASKIMTAEEALELLKDGDTLGVSGGGLRGNPDYLMMKLEEKFLNTKTPRDLTLYSVVGHGAFDHRGDSRIAYPGLIKKAVVTHPDTNTELREMIGNEELDCYILPQGVSVMLLRCIAHGQPGYITKVGLGTYCDPRNEGCKVNERTMKQPDMVKVIELEGEEYLMYKPTPLDVVFIRGTTADENGNISIEHEANWIDYFELANAARACGGKVIAQVKRIVKAGTIHPQQVRVPGVMVDAVVVCQEWEKYHMQNDNTPYNDVFSGHIKVPFQKASASAELKAPMNIIERRAAMELFPGAIVNLGWGIPGGIGAVAEAEDLIEELCLTVEMGVFGGVPGKFPNFGSVVNADAVVSLPNMFDAYYGGILDVCFLGSAQVDPNGSTNLSKLDDRIIGPGGSMDISTSSKKCVFCLGFTAKGVKQEVVDGKLRIIQEGSVKKFVNKLDQITFNGVIAGQKGKPVVYVTERAVFELINGVLTLTEIAPGIDLEKDVLQQMEFTPAISKDLKLMDARVFVPGVMGIINDYKS
ncbi:MAG: hypothetical protein LBT32_04120 [Peptococcaceae bacterium]|nr:hypothetical protein [Peptococcaceae bacterium]